MRGQNAVLAAMLAMVPLGAQAADLVVWWEEGYYAQEDEAVGEIIAAFEQGSGKQVELVFYPEQELPERIEAALRVSKPPDFAFGLGLISNVAGWALDDRLVDLTDTVGHLSDLFDPEALAWWALPNEKTGQRALYALPVGRSTNHVHVWKSLLEQAGFTRNDIPGEWGRFWAFWCEVVQPAVRRALGREDVWGVGLTMSREASDTSVQFRQFIAAYGADYVTRDGRLVIGNPEVRRRLIKAIDSYTGIYRSGCSPPDSVSWTNIDNNEQFLAQAVVMTPNDTLSIPNALKRRRPEDYYKNAATIEWPLGMRGEPFPIGGFVFPAVVFNAGSNVAAAKEFVRFLVAESWLAHYLDFAGERMLPPMPKLLQQPFWLDPSDPHRMAAVMQIASRPMQHDYATVSGDWRYERQENVWPNAIHRIVTEGITPEQAVDEAIARIKQILSE